MRTHDKRRVPRGGFSLLEVLIAAVLLLVVFFGLAGTYMKGRRQMGYEEDRRRATGLAQATIDGLRRNSSYDGLPAYNGVTSATTLEQRVYTVSLAVAPEQPQQNSTTVTATVTWNARVNTANVARTVVCTTILGRGLAPAPLGAGGEASHPVDDGVNHDEGGG